MVSLGRGPCKCDELIVIILLTRLMMIYNLLKRTICFSTLAYAHLFSNGILVPPWKKLNKCEKVSCTFIGVASDGDSQAGR